MFTNLSQEELNAKNNKMSYTRNDVVTTKRYKSK